MKTLANKRFWLGMLAVALSFSLTVVGCEEEGAEPNYINIKNGTTFDITYVEISSGGRVIATDNDGISAGASEKYDLTVSDPVFVKVNVNVNGESVEVTRGVAGVSSSKGDYVQGDLLLSGQTKDALTLQ